MVATFFDVSGNTGKLRFFDAASLVFISFNQLMNKSQTQISNAAFVKRTGLASSIFSDARFYSVTVLVNFRLHHISRLIL